MYKQNSILLACFFLFLFFVQFIRIAQKSKAKQGLKIKMIKIKEIYMWKIRVSWSVIFSAVLLACVFLHHEWTNYGFIS